MHDWLLNAYKLWRIITAKSLEITGSIAILLFAPNDVWLIALSFVIIGLLLYGVNAYVELDEMTLPERSNAPWNWKTWRRRMVRITLDNGFWILTGTTFVLFVTGLTLIWQSLLTITGYALMYAEQYRIMEEKEKQQ